MECDYLAANNSCKGVQRTIESKGFSCLAVNNTRKKIISVWSSGLGLGFCEPPKAHERKGRKDGGT